MRAARACAEPRYPHRPLRTRASSAGMAPLYEVIMMTKTGKGMGTHLQRLVESCAKTFWSRGAVLADIQPWGARDLAYRIRKGGVNHYQANYISLHVYCSPPTLNQVVDQLRNSDHVLRWMTLKQQSVPSLDKATRRPHKAPPPKGGA